jgi:hypothetical protein
VLIDDPGKAVDVTSAFPAPREMLLVRQSALSEEPSWAVETGCHPSNYWGVVEEAMRHLCIWDDVMRGESGHNLVKIWISTVG